MQGTLKSVITQVLQSWSQNQRLTLLWSFCTFQPVLTEITPQHALSTPTRSLLGIPIVLYCTHAVIFKILPFADIYNSVLVTVAWICLPRISSIVRRHLLMHLSFLFVVTKNTHYNPHMLFTIITFFYPFSLWTNHTCSTPGPIP